MKRLKLLLIILFVTIDGFCQIKNIDKNLVLIRGYLYGNTTNNSENILEDVIYKRESVYIFNYKYTDKNGKEFFFYINKDGSWDFIDVNQTNKNVVTNIKLKILKKDLHYTDPIHCQTAITYTLDKNNLYSEMTGLIENSKNIWLHPPRLKLFSILELNPFPYVKFPLEIGKSWSWSLEIGGQWGDKRWKEWSGNIENKYQYKIVGKKIMKTSVGSLECYVIESQAKSELGITKLISYFNEQYGFVKLDYTNIDNSKLEINLQGKEIEMINFLKNSL
jgi:hypothetical protein